MTYSLPEGISLLELDATASANQVSRLVWIWAQANPGIDCTTQERLIQRHFQCPGFRCLTACSSDIIVGFTYGLHHGQGTGLGDAEGNFSIGSHDLLEKTITAGLVQSAWLDAFEIAEVQVLSEHRRQGLGETLVRALCDRLPSDRVVLTVADQAKDAKRLYHRLGFREVLTAVPPVSPPVLLTVMGTTLPLLSLGRNSRTSTIPESRPRYAEWRSDLCSHGGSDVRKRRTLSTDSGQRPPSAVADRYVIKGTIMSVGPQEASYGVTVVVLMNVDVLPKEQLTVFPQ